MSESRLDAITDFLSVLPAVQTDYDPELFCAVLRAVIGRRRLEMAYWTARGNETTSRLFDPYKLTVVDDGWYALGCCHRSTQVRIYQGETMASRPGIRRSSRQQSDREVSPQRPARYQAVVNVLWHRSRGVGVPGTPYITRRGRYQSFPGRGCNSRRLQFLLWKSFVCKELRLRRTRVGNPPP